MKVSAGFNVDREDISTKVFEGLEVSVWVYDHKVNVKGFCGVLCNGFYNGHAKTDVGYKYSIHHINVKPISIT